MKWTEHWRICCGFTMDEAEGTALERWLDDQFPAHGTDRGWSGDELGQAIETLAEEARDKGQRLKAPTGPQLKSAIIKARWAKSPKRAEGKPQDCDLCCNGHIAVYPDNPEPPWTIPDLVCRRVLMIACRCRAGHEAEAYFGRSPDALFDLARRQNGAINAAGLAVGEEYERAKAYDEFCKTIGHPQQRATVTQAAEYAREF